MAALTTTALVIAATAGRVVDAIIIAVLLVPALVFLLVWIGSQRGWFGGKAG